MTGTEQLENFQTAVETASNQARTAWVTFLSAATYLMIVVLGTTHRQLVLEGSVKLPLLNVDLPVFTFYLVAPVLLLLLHLSLLIQLYLLATKLHRLNVLLKQELRLDAEREWQRSRLDSFPLTQMLAGSRQSWASTILFRLMILITVIAVPVGLLLAMQIRFLPYHDIQMTWWHRVVLGVDLLTLCVLWPGIVQPGGRLSRGASGVATPIARSSGTVPAEAWATLGRVYRLTRLAVASLLVLAFALLVATIPGEPIEAWLLQQPWVYKVKRRSGEIWAPTAVLFNGNMDELRQTLDSPFSRYLVLPEADLVDDRAYADADSSISLRGRDLTHALLSQVDLKKADLRATRLEGASFYEAYLREARLNCVGSTFSLEACTHLRKANFIGAQLQGANLTGAHLQDTNFTAAQLQGANLQEAQLQGANLMAAQLQGANLTGALLHGAYLGGAQLQGANLTGAQLQGANLREAKLQGANLTGALLWAADLRRASIWRALPPNWPDVDLAELGAFRLDPLSTNAVEALQKVPAKISNNDIREEILARLLPLLVTQESVNIVKWREKWHKLFKFYNKHRNSNPDHYEYAQASYLGELACESKDTAIMAAIIMGRLPSAIPLRWTRTPWGPPGDQRRRYQAYLVRHLLDPASCPTFAELEGYFREVVQQADHHLNPPELQGAARPSCSGCRSRRHVRRHGSSRQRSNCAGRRPRRTAPAQPCCC
jgi:uncharacterized protein YjbI with pentapeptide repeats